MGRRMENGYVAIEVYALPVLEENNWFNVYTDIFVMYHCTLGFSYILHSD